MGNRRILLLQENWNLRANETLDIKASTVSWNCNITSLTGKEHQMVEEAKRCSLDIIGISSTGRRGCSTVELDDEWKFFYSGVEPAKFAQAGVGILVSHQLANCVDEWIRQEWGVCMLPLKLLAALCVWYRYTVRTQVHCNRNSWKKLVTPCEELKLAIRRSFWETSMHTLGTMPRCGRVWSADVVMLTLMITEDSCCNCVVITHRASWAFSAVPVQRWAQVYLM